MLKTQGLGASGKKKKKCNIVLFFFRTHLAPVTKKCISIIKKSSPKHTRDQRTQAVK